MDMTGRMKSWRNCAVRSHLREQRPKLGCLAWAWVARALPPAQVLLKVEGIAVEDAFTQRAEGLKLALDVGDLSLSALELTP